MRSTLQWLGTSVLGVALSAQSLEAQPTPTPGAVGAASASRPGDSHRLLTWNLPSQVLPLFETLESGGKGDLAIIGDSISFAENSYNWFLKALFEADYGSGGEGFLSPSGMRGACEGDVYVRCGVDMDNTQGAWASLNSGPRHPRSYGLDVDGNYAIIQESSTGIHGRYFLYLYGDEVTVHYIKEPGAGTFQVLLNKSTITTINADIPGEPEHASVTVPTGAENPDEINEITLRHISGGSVYLDGYQMSYGQSGFVYHRLARGGAGPDDFLDCIGQPTSDFLGTLDAELILVMLDWAGLNNAEPYVTNMNTLLDFLEGAAPNSKFILVSHHAFYEGIGQEADWLYLLARQRGHGYINLFDLHAGSGELGTLGFLEDEVHLTAAGGSWFADYIYGVLTDAAADARTADHNRDGVFDYQDLLAFLEGFVGADADTDVNADGSNDSADLTEFLDAFRRVQWASR